MLRRWTLAALVVAAVVTPATVTARDGENAAPLADAGLDQQVELGTTVLLDATGSRDPDGELQSYEWRIETPGGGTIVPQCPTCGRTDFLPTQVGTYVVTVTVIDDDGVQSADTLYVTVDEATGRQRAGKPTTPDTPAPTSSPDPDPVVNPLGTDPPASSGTLCARTTTSCLGEIDIAPWVDIVGPDRIEPDQQAEFRLLYGGFDQDPQFGWSIGVSGTSGSETWNSPGERTIYVTGASDTQVARATHDVQVTENQKPRVDIQVPESIHAGQTITLSADVSDPDGRVVSVEWENGPRVTVPTGNDENEIIVKAMDDDNSESIDSVVISSDDIRSGLRSNPNSIHTVYCYYNQESERERQAPDHCEVKDSDNSADTDGYQSLTANVDRMLQSSNYDIVWKKTERDVSQHSGDLADDRGIRMPDVVDNDGSSISVPTFTEAQRDAITGDAVATSTQSFTLNGKTVNNDLDGDGQIDAADWDERFGSTDRSASESHRDTVDELKDARRATNQANGAGGAQAGTSNDPSDSGNDHSTDSGGQSAKSGASGGTGDGQNDPLGGSLPDDLGITDPTAEHVAEKQQDIVENGFDGGLY